MLAYLSLHDFQHVYAFVVIKSGLIWNPRCWVQFYVLFVFFIFFMFDSFCSRIFRFVFLEVFNIFFLLWFCFWVVFRSNQDLLFCLWSNQKFLVNSVGSGQKKIRSKGLVPCLVFYFFFVKGILGLSMYFENTPLAYFG